MCDKIQIDQNIMKAWQERIQKNIKNYMVIKKK